MPVAHSPANAPIPRTTAPVDIVVPVYKGLEDTRRCLESVLAAQYQLSTWRLIVINDCSPEPEVTQWLREFSKRDARIELLENPQNLGFVGTVNRGMQLSSRNDVLLLNSDTEVANDWLDRIQACAYSRDRVATVTPFSNNATICSYPRFCKPNELPDGYDTASLDALFARELAGQAVEVPTGVGFCMYIRRASLTEVGLFDEANFGKGYGEENDFCIRANEAGWLNLHAYDTFVRHAGGISFGDSKSERELQAMVTLNRLHPTYEGNVMQFVHRDPAHLARFRVDLARIVNSGKPVILNVMHNREGGTLRHVQELARHLAKNATYLRLSPSGEGVELRLEGAHEGFMLRFDLPHGTDRLLQTLRNLQVSHIHFHHVLGYDPTIVELPTQLGVSFDFTAHDFYSYCPQISLTDQSDRYCGEQGIAQCMQCVKKRPAPGGEDIESWRKRHQSLLGKARFVIAPSLDCAQRIHSFAPGAIVRSVPHSALLDETPEQRSLKAPVNFAATRPLRVVVLGALSKIKGADLLEQTALLAAKSQAPVEFHLIGYAYRSLRTQPHAHLTVHGSYEDSDLPRLLQWLQPELVWFPALWPETYSYTLSAALEQGLPIVAPNIGAFSERLHQREWSWVIDWQISAVQQLEFFTKIRLENFVTGKPPAPYLHRVDTESTLLQSPFDYFSDYLQDLKPPSEGKLDDPLVEALASHLATQSASVAGASKSAALDTLVRLRANPMLSGVARLIPSHWQRRIKNWLSS